MSAQPEAKPEIGRSSDQLIPEAKPEPKLGAMALRQIGRYSDQIALRQIGRFSDQLIPGVIRFHPR